MKASLYLVQRPELICACCGQPHEGRKTWEDRLSALIHGTESFALCPLCTRVVPERTFKDLLYRLRCLYQVQRLQRLYENHVKKQNLNQGKQQGRTQIL